MTLMLIYIMRKQFVPYSWKLPSADHKNFVFFFFLSLTVVVDVQDSSEVIGHLVVTVEALEALTSIMKDPERDRPLTTLA